MSSKFTRGLSILFGFSRMLVPAGARGRRRACSADDESVSSCAMSCSMLITPPPRCGRSWRCRNRWCDPSCASLSVPRGVCGSRLVASISSASVAPPSRPSSSRTRSRLDLGAAASVVAICYSERPIAGVRFKTDDGLAPCARICVRLQDSSPNLRKSVVKNFARRHCQTWQANAVFAASLRVCGKSGTHLAIYKVACLCGLMTSRR